MSNTPKKKVVLTKPNWPKNDPFWNFWNLLNEFVQNRYSKDFEFITHSISPGLSGKKQTERYIVQNHEQCNLIFAHHIDKRLHKAIDYKMSYLPDLFYFANEGYNAFSNICNKDLLSVNFGENTYNDFYANRIENTIEQTKYVHDNTNAVEKDIPKEFLFVPLQVENDTVMKLKNIPTQRLIDHAIEVSKRLDVPLVIKAHPKAPKNNNVLRAVNRRILSEKNCFMSNGDVRQLLDRSVGIITISSGVGFEALLRLKHVFTYGKCDYQQIANPNATVDKVCEVLNSPVNEALTKQFLYHWWQEIVDIQDKDLFQKFETKINKWLENA
jgi:hypothetical protein